MIRSLFICSALVASSAAGAVALSALHDATGDRSVRTLASVPTETIEARFVIPSYAPSQRAPEVIPAAVRNVPVQPSESLRDPVPAEVLTHETLSDDTPEPQPLITPRARPVIAARPAVVHTAPVRPQSSARAKQRVAKPVIVAQVPAFTAQQQTALQPDWVIGVYR